MANTDQLLDNKAAAAMLSISTRTLAKLRENGDIPIVRVNGTRKGIRYSAAALNDFIASRSRKPTPSKSM